MSDGAASCASLILDENSCASMHVMSRDTETRYDASLILDENSCASMHVMSRGTETRYDA